MGKIHGNKCQKDTMSNTQLVNFVERNTHEVIHERTHGEKNKIGITKKKHIKQDKKRNTQRVTNGETYIEDQIERHT